MQVIRRVEEDVVLLGQEGSKAVEGYEETQGFLGNMVHEEIWGLMGCLVL